MAALEHTTHQIHTELLRNGTLHSKAILEASSDLLGNLALRLLHTEGAAPVRLTDTGPMIDSEISPLSCQFVFRNIWIEEQCNFTLVRCRDSSNDRDNLSLNLLL